MSTIDRCTLHGLLWILVVGSSACGDEGKGKGTALGSIAGTAGQAGASSAGAGAGVMGNAGAGVMVEAGISGSAAGSGAAADSGTAGSTDVSDAGTGAAGMGSTSTTGTLPAVTDLQKPGPFTPKQSPGPAGFVVVHPQELGQDGIKHPIVSWGPGATENAGSFTTLLQHLASHGFVVISYDGTPQGQELATAIDWLVAENDRSGSAFHQKLDASKVCAAGHSAGSLATFRIGADERLTTTIHLSGGTFDPHTDIDNLHAPAMFICGESGGDGLVVGDVARPNCDIDFMNAKVPVFYGIPKGASHMTGTEIGDPTLRSHILGAFVGWLRWQLAADETQQPMFVGGSCTLCSDPIWTTQQKGVL